MNFNNIYLIEYKIEPSRDIRKNLLLLGTLCILYQKNKMELNLNKLKKNSNIF